MKRQTIQEIDETLDALHRKLTRTVRRIDELRAKRRKIILGKIKRVPQPGVKVMLPKSNPNVTHADLNDLLPSFGPR